MDLPRDPTESRASNSVNVWESCMSLLIPKEACTTFSLYEYEKIMVRKDYITSLEDAIAYSEVRYEAG